MNGSIASTSVPGWSWWAMLGAVLACGFAVHWGIAAALLFVLLAFAARPFDFLTAYLLVVSGASFVTIAGGTLTYQLGFLSIGIVLMLAFYVLATPGRVFALAATRLTWPLLAYLVWSLINAARGFLLSDRRYVGIELIAILALGSSLLVANAFRPKLELRLATGALIVIAYPAAIRAVAISSSHLHTVQTYAFPVPGIIGVFLINLALRARTLTRSLVFVLLSVPLFMQQFITLGRGLWTGCLAGTLLSVLVFAGVGRGTATRWNRVGLVLAMLVGLGAIGGIQAALLLGRTNLVQEAGARFASIGSTEATTENRSTYIRLWEYSVVAGQILRSPLFGHGLGASFSVHQPGAKKVWGDQWVVHENYLMVWFKQGLLGLSLFLWMIWTATVLGIREARRRTDPLEAAWCASMAAGTVFLAVFSLSNFPFSEVTGMFLLALLWGVTMALTRSESVYFQWAPVGAAQAKRLRETRPSEL